jgi:hypothetical protein
MIIFLLYSHGALLLQNCPLLLNGFEVTKGYLPYNGTISISFSCIFLCFTLIIFSMFQPDINDSDDNNAGLINNNNFINPFKKKYIQNA